MALARSMEMEMVVMVVVVAGPLLRRCVALARSMEMVEMAVVGPQGGKAWRKTRPW